MLEKRRAVRGRRRVRRTEKGFWGRTYGEKQRLKAEYQLVKLRELQPWKDNPRLNDQAIPLVAKLIKKHGFAGAVVATPNGVLCAGHTRWEALKLLQDDEQYLAKLKFDPSLGTPGKVWVHWKNFPSEAARDAFALADNKSSEVADWDRGKLAKLFKSRTKADLKVLEHFSGFRRKEIEWDGEPAVQPEELDDFEDIELNWHLRIPNVSHEDRDEIVQRIKKALEGTEYEVRINIT